MKYFIAEENMAKLQEKLTKVQNKCKKLGCSYTFVVTGNVEYRKVTVKGGNDETQKFIEVDAEGIARVNGWEFIATIEHKEAGNIIRSFNTEVAVPAEYYTVAPKCDHCKSDRSRKDTYVIRNENGKFMQVGRSCLRDFTDNALSAEAIAQFMMFFEELEDEDGEGFSGQYGKKYFDRDRYLSIVSELVRLHGYTKYADAQERGIPSTVAVANELYISHKAMAKMMTEEGLNPEAALTSVKESIAWILGTDAKDGYLWNLKIACSSEWLEGRDLGIAASLIPSHFRFLEKEADRLAREARKAELQGMAKSEFLGNVGDRLTFNVTDGARVGTFDSQFGTTYIYKFFSGSNILVWMTGSSFDASEVKVLKGTVKEHSEFRNEKQTILSRCKII